MTRDRRRQPLPFHELCLAPFAGFLLLLCLWLCPQPSDGNRQRCPCGAPLGPAHLPELEGPDELRRAPLLRIDNAVERHGGWVATLDGSEVDARPRDDDVEWKSKLTEQLEILGHNERILHPEMRRPREIILSVRADFAPENLRRYLYQLGMAGRTHVQLMLPGGGRSWNTAAYVSLVRTKDCGALALDRFKTYEELARAVVALRRDGLPARLAIFR